MTAGVWNNEDGSGEELKGLKSMKVQIVKSARVIGAPVESGQTSFDNKVLDPTKVIVTGVIVIDREGKFRETLKTLNSMWASRAWKFYFASDGFNSQGNLILQTFPTTRDVEKFDWISVELTFVERMLVQKDNKTASSEDTNCKNIGYVQGTQM